MKLFIIAILCFILGVILTLIYKEKDEPVGTIYVNLSNPEEEFFRCSVEPGFMKAIAGPEAKDIVKFVIVVE